MSWADRPFQPKDVSVFPNALIRQLGDRRDGGVYVYDGCPEIELAVNMSIVTRRPLLVSGPTGCGKSSLAKNIALVLSRPYVEYVATSRSDSIDLLWSYDAIARLADAQRPDRTLGSPASYVIPGPLWWSLSPTSASAQAEAAGEYVANADRFKPRQFEGAQGAAVLLIDEIDKANIDFASNLLVPLGSGQIICDHIAEPIVAEQTPIIVVTTNGERSLPDTFVRRCIALPLPRPSSEALVRLAMVTLPHEGITPNEGFARAVLAALNTVEPETNDTSAAEYLDTLIACHLLGIEPSTNHFSQVIGLTVRKASA